MKLNLKCLPCNINQVLKITELINCGDHQTKAILSDVFNLLKNVDYELPNPHTMKFIIEIIQKHTGNDNPYKEVKEYYNRILLEQFDEIESMVLESNNIFLTALKTAIIGNIIDFGPAHKFDKEIILSKIRSVNDYNLTIDNSDALKESLSSSKSLLYIGDNCGELVLDKIFIKILKRLYPSLHITFAVRGKPALNDVTIDDAVMVNMHELADVIDSGDRSPGAIINDSSDEFKNCFNSSDIVIAKGQGNYEGLSDEKRNNLFLLFMAKCEVVAGLAGVEKMSIVCLNN
ncbi:ARMT1-like domain-containing protein [Clostridiaceae bacterium M8S5]|nr:ARMT1-like domain-containing protein [Clostridiaceae bacterium M8S5]